ncbi:MAG: PQQ-dependent sugar dehydrogenase, partial [Pseudomonadota bacterium]
SFVFALLFTAPVQANMTGPLGLLQVTPQVTGLENPWAFGFLPDGSVMITQTDGHVVLAKDGQVTKLTGGPEVVEDGQGGLLDVLIPADFATSRQVYFTFAKRQGGGSGTALARAVLPDGATAFSNVETLFEIAPGSRGGRHFGSRLAEAPDGYLYMSVGDRGDRPSAQDTSRENGSILRLTRDGTIPDDNPIPGSAIWSLGHRNPQGLTFDASGQLWGIEHGARGGDEVNLIERGANYGWPVIAYGRHYSGARIGTGTAQEGMEQPDFYWDPSIAPSGATVLGRSFGTAWDGALVTGSLKFDQIHVLSVQGGLSEIAVLASDETLRVRDVRVGPQGALWFLSVGNGALYKVTPSQ